jgi:hypothetical protein
MLRRSRGWSRPPDGRYSPAHRVGRARNWWRRRSMRPSTGSTSFELVSTAPQPLGGRHRPDGDSGTMTASLHTREVAVRNPPRPSRKALLSGAFRIGASKLAEAKSPALAETLAERWVMEETYRQVPPSSTAALQRCSPTGCIGLRWTQCDSEDHLKLKTARPPSGLWKTRARSSGSRGFGKSDGCWS